MRHGYLLALALLVFLLPVASSIEVYVKPPKMIARMDVIPGQASTYEGSLEVKDLNNYTVNVTLTPQGDIADKIQLSETSLSLEPGEARDVGFTITLDQPGTYEGLVVVAYLTEDSPGVGLQVEIIAVGTEVEQEESNNSGGNNILKYMIIGFIVLVTIILALLLLKRRGV